MDKQLMLSVAGSGKTTYVVNSLEIEKRALIVTYTENNYANLHQKIILKFGFMPDNILVITYFNFLYSFCYRPFLLNDVKANGYNYMQPHPSTLRMKRENIRYYVDSSNRLYHNRLAKLLEVLNVYPKICERIEKYFDEFYVDEVQDFAGHDFNLLLEISNISKKVLFVGDYFQHTFDTSRDGNANKNLHEDYDKYIERFKKIGFNIDTDLLSKSHRCSKSICDFITNDVGINIEAHNDIITDVKLITDDSQINVIMQNDDIIKLFYQNSKKYNCYSANWGESKGQDHYVNVCVILNKSTFNLYNKNKLNDMNIKTRNKFYVACTRARNDLMFIPESLVTDYKQ